MHPVLRRRSFLRRCCETAGAVVFPANFRAWVFARSEPPAPDFHLHPHYREQAAIDAELLKVNPDADGFKTEQRHVKIAEILSGWRRGLLASPQNVQPIADALSGQFAGTPWHPIENRLLRPVSIGLDMRQIRYGSEAALGSKEFANDFRSALNSFDRILSAEFQTTKIQADANGLTSWIRYELVGTGQGFYREQRIGNWVMQWDISSWHIMRWEALDEVRSRSAEALFTDVTRAALGGNPSYRAQLLHGADYWRTVLDGACGIDVYGHNGVSVGDIDGDGNDDIYVCQPAGLPNRLYRNRGDGTFDDITDASGVGILENTACALFADFHNAGRQDLVVVRANGPLLFVNDGGGKFKLKPDAFHFANPPQGTFTGAAAADFDRDGRLDVYFCLYSYYQGADQYRYPTPYFAAENGPPNFLLKNNGNGTFEDVTAKSGLNRNNTRYSFCCGWGDYNGDGWPDLYVVNDFGKKNLYRNNGNGTFTDLAQELGVEDVGAGMSVCWLDYDNDGAGDLYVGNMWTAAGERVSQDENFQAAASKEMQAMYRKHAMGNTLLQNKGSRFNDVTHESHAGIGRWAWSSDAWDFDHDGYSDVYVTNGMISGPVKEDLNSFFWRQVVAKSPNAAKSDSEYETGWTAINELIRADYSWSGYERNVVFANNGNGTFSDVSGVVGLDFPEDGRAFALADFDGDGRQEILLKNRNAPQLRLMKNGVSGLPPAISFRLSGTKSNTDAIGAAVTVRTNSGKQTKMLQAGSGFLSQHSKELFFGLGSATGSVSATIRWPSGLVQELQDLPANHCVWVTEGLAPKKIRSFNTPGASNADLAAVPPEEIPEKTETWLLSPVYAPMLTVTGKPELLTFGENKPNDDFSAVYNLLFRYIFDRHSDLPLPTSFLIDEHGQIVKVYRGPVDPKRLEEDRNNIPRTESQRLAKALPFPGVSNTFEFARNYLSLGSIFFQRGYFQPAGEFFRFALQNDPASAEAFYGLGSVYLKQTKNDDALDCFDKATQLTASYPETKPNAWNNLGLLATQSGDITKAVRCFEQALSINPDHFVALENLGNAYRQQRRWEDARARLERALTIKPEDPEANYSLGMVFAQMDDSARAYDYLEKALQARPKYPEALNNLGVLYLRTKRRDEAVASFEKCIQVAPEFDQSYLNLARVYAIEGDSNKARSTLRSLLALRPDDAAVQQALERLP